MFPGGNPFGYYSYLTNPKYIFHFDLGYEYVFDANDGKAGVYLYDFKSGGFFYTSLGFPFPYLYDFSLNTVLYYYPDPNSTSHYNTDGTRYFYRFDTGRSSPSRQSRTWQAELGTAVVGPQRVCRSDHSYPASGRASFQRH